MFKRGYLIILLLAGTSCFSQKEKNAEGYAEVKLASNATPEQTIQKAIDKAKVNAIDNAFGSVVLEGNTLYTINKQTGTKTEFNQTYKSISDIYVNGEWIKDVEPAKTERIVRDNDIFYSASVKGLIRELKSNPAKFSVKTLTCDVISCASEFFNNGNDFYMYFKAPNDGYVAVYLDFPVEGTTYRVLPYKQESNSAGYFVKADEEYFFFSSKKAKPEMAGKVDELTLTLKDKSMPETNKMFVLYSPKQALEKPILTNSKSQAADAASQEAEIPLNLKSEEYQRWLQHFRSQNNEIQLITNYITVKP